MRWPAALLVAAASACATAREEPALARARAALAEAPARAGALHLACEPADAEVYVDGVPQGRCAELKGGLAASGRQHQVEVKKAGFWPYQLYYAPDGTRLALTVTLQPLSNAQGASP